MSAEQRKPLSEGSSKRFEPTPKMGVVGSSGIRIFVSRYDIRDAIASVGPSSFPSRLAMPLDFEVTGHILQVWEDQAPGKRSFRPA